MAWMYWRQSQPPDEPAQEPPVAMVQVRLLSIAALHDCASPASERIRGKLARAVTAQDLWLLRGEIYQEVARAHCETEAMRRVNSLLPAFEGWLPSLRRLG